MAARQEPKNGRAWTPEKVRERIKVALLARRLQHHALGKLEMTESQRRATEILLKKTLPDLQSIEAHHSGDIGVQITVSPTDAKL